MATVINQIKYDGVEYAIAASAYATCDTASATQAKVASIVTDDDTSNNGFTLIKGVSIQVFFTNTNTAASPTLNVQSSGAKSIFYKGAAVPTNFLKASRTYTFIYNGTNWVVVGDIVNAVNNNPTLAWGTTSTVGTVDGVDLKVTMPANPNTDNDTKVTQAYSTTSGSYPVLMSATSGISSTSSRGATTAVLNNQIYANPNTGNLRASSFTEGSLPLSTKYGTLLPWGTAVPSSANLNNIAYLKVGNYYCSADATVATLTNCPTGGRAFMMQVYSPLSTATDNESTGTWVYRIRKILTYTGEEYIQNVSSGATAGSFSFGTWRKTSQYMTLSGTTLTINL